MRARSFSLLRTLAFACVLVGLVRPAAAQTSGQNPVNSPTVTTSGEGVVLRAADRAYLDIAVETRAKDPRDAQAQNATAMTNVQQKLRAAIAAARLTSRPSASTMPHTACALSGLRPCRR